MFIHMLLALMFSVNGGWAPWDNWSSCSATCGGGQKTRQRVCILSGGRADCSGIIDHKLICNNISCPGEIYV